MLKAAEDLGITNAEYRAKIIADSKQRIENVPPNPMKRALRAKRKVIDKRTPNGRCLGQDTETDDKRVSYFHVTKGRRKRRI